MKRKDIQDLHTKTIDELKKMVSDGKTALMDMKIDHTQFKLKNTRSLMMKRKDIAQIASIIRGKELVNNG
ncbi:MAG: 50S ribosomal protein L29 [Candidatus Levybacteria bacterium]|nr:50S ribosomal protein L29 [Candidatus Levybacteria bacterium]